jgi:hypothetical protein
MRFGSSFFAHELPDILYRIEIGCGPLNELAISVLQRQMGEQSEYVFPYKGKPLTQVNTKHWRAALKRAGITDFRWRNLRHTWAGWLRQSDVSTWVLQELGGWKSEKMVRRYAHMLVKNLQPYADRPILEGKTGHTALKEERSRRVHRRWHSDSRPRLQLVAGTDLSH